MNIEYVLGQEQHTESWAKFYVKGLEKWAVKEDFPENISDNHHGYQGYTCLDIPDGAIFTVFDQSGDKRGTQDFNFYICQTSADALDVTASSGRGRCQGNFRNICAGEGKTKAPRLMDWWIGFVGEDDASKASNKEKVAFALHCAAHINKRGIKELPPLSPRTQGDAITSHEPAETVKELQSEAVETPETPQKQWLNLGLIALNAGTQSRKAIDQATIDDYAEQMQDGRWQWEREPLPLLFSYGKNFWPGDGHHRLMAADKASIEQIFVEVRPGTLREAIFYSTSVNKYHGLPRTNADKRNQAELLLSDPEWQIRSDRAIAEHCGVSAPFVGKIRSELAQKGTVNLSSERVDRKGRRIETANIGTKPKKAKSTPTSHPEQTSPANTGSQSLEKSPTAAALIEEAMPGSDPELLKPSSPEVERAIANGKTAFSEQAQPQTATHPAEEDLQAVLETRIIAAEAQITALSHKVGARMIAEIALELCTLEEIREIHADLSLNLEALDEEK